MDWQPQASDQDLRTDPMLRDVPEIEGFKVLEPCVLYARLGQGGMGTVYRGRHLNLEIDVAVKCLNKALALQGSGFVERFQREARLAASIHHQNLVQVYDVSQRSGVHYLVMEYVTGETARDRVGRKGPLSAQEALKILFGAASGLSEAHAKKIVHRDIKPDNILISHDGRVKVADLGLAKALEVSEGQTLTQGVMGTPQYMAPEQWEDSSRVGPTADVWALGATLYFLLAGENAIPSGSMQQVCRRICVDPFPDVRAKAPRTPGEVVALIERCVDRDPAHRIADCRELLRVLQPLLGVEAGSLADPMSGTTRIKRTLLSPPPPHTLARIRVAVDTKKITDDATLLHGDSPAGPSGPARGAPWAMGGPRAPLATPVGGDPTIPAVTPVPAPAAPAPRAEKKRVPAVQIALAVVLVGVLGGWAVREFMRTTQAQVPETPTTSLPDTGDEQAITEVNPVVPAPEEIPSRKDEPATELARAQEESTQELERVEPPPDEPEAPLVPPSPAPVQLFVAEIPAFTSAAVLGVRGTVSNARAASLDYTLSIDGKADEPVRGTAEITEGAFELTVDLGQDGPYVLTLSTDGLEQAALVSTVRDTGAPTFVSVGPESEVPFGTRTPSLFAEVDDPNLSAVLAGGKPMVQDPGTNRWSLAASELQEGRNQLVFRAVDRAGNSSENELSLTLDTIQPGLRVLTPLDSELLSAGREFELRLEFGEAIASAEIRTMLESPPVALVVDGTGASGRLRAPEDSTTLEVEWRAKDAAGNEGTGTITWTVDTAPLHPAGCIALDTTYGYERWAKRVKHERSGIVLLLIEPGRFQMGGSDAAALADEKPVQEVQIPSPFYLAETETTQAQWKSIMGKRVFPFSGDELPASGISWFEAQQFCAATDFRLPTEAEWEYACRAGSTRAFNSGDSLKEGDALFSTASILRSQATRVRSYAANAWGFRDMHGNVREWCADTYDATRYQERLESPEEHLHDSDPGGKRGDPRVLRGGSFLTWGVFCRSSARSFADPRKLNRDTGFRVALSVQ